MIFARSLGKAGALLLLMIVAAAGGPLEDLKSVSQIPGIDLAQLKNGQILTRRGSEGNFSRGISLESCYFVPAPITTVGNALLHWDPTKHSGSETRLYREYSFPAAPAVFQSVRLSSSVENDRWILEHTFDIADGGNAGDLHLTPAEVDLIRKEVPKKGAASAEARAARANDTWGMILHARSQSLAHGGIAAVAAYGSAAGITPGSEYRGLLSLEPRAAKFFRPIANARPLAAGGSAADEAVGYWETTQVRGHTTLQLGLFAARKSADSWQLADCVYYPSDTYFMALDFFQLWPLDGGTLVWQVGFVSAPFRSYLGGMDRYIAGKQMTQETIDTIKNFQRAMKQRR